jgi:hypothetical protein
VQIAAGREAAGVQCSGPRVQIGLAGECAVERLELPCRLQEQCRGSAARASGEGDLPAEQADLGTFEVIERAGLRRGRQLQSRVERAGLQIRLRGHERALGPPGRVSRQRDRALEERRRCGHAAAGLRPAR